MGRAGGVTGGRDGNVHFGDRRLGCVGMVSMLPDMMLVATGMAMAFKLRGERRCALTWFGDGATSRGDFHEAMNWAGVQQLPVIFVLENNQYAYSTPIDKQFAVDPVERAAAYGFAGVTVDGNDVEAMFEATRAARERALAGDGPTLIEAVTMRMHGHAAHDDMSYVPKELLEEWRKRDPIDRQEARLRALGVDVDALREEVAAEIDAATEEALAAPMPDPSSAAAGVFCEGEAEPLGDGMPPWSGFRSAGRLCSPRPWRARKASGGLPEQLTYLQAISDALARRAARRRARAGDGRGHRRVRRRLQGHRRHASRSSGPIA